MVQKTCLATVKSSAGRGPAFEGDDDNDDEDDGDDDKDVGNDDDDDEDDKEGDGDDDVHGSDELVGESGVNGDSIKIADVSKSYMENFPNQRLLDAKGWRFRCESP